VQIHSQVDHRVRLTVHDEEPAGDFAVRLAAGRLPRLERPQQPLPEREVGASLEGGEHRVGDLGTHDRVRRHHHVAVDAMARPRLVPGARSRGREPAHVQTSELPALDELVIRRDLFEDQRRRAAGAQQIQTEMTQTRIGAGLGDDGAHTGGDVDAPRADGHLAGRDRDAEHAGTLAPADEGERRVLDTDHQPPQRSGSV
jgi:hypothetical protein